ncbi:MAG TPA: hypothetical protein VLM05_06410 [Mycobacteriales bacterium]|nr:hypothetical protein [Mycobacteriales bacterium]
MPPPVRLVLAEMTAGAGLVLGMLLLAVAVAGGLAMVPPEAGPSWSNPFNLALTGLMVVGPLCAGGVAWLVRDYRVRGIGALAASTNRGTAGGALPRLAAACAWAGLAYLVLLGLFTARTAHRGAPAGAPLLLALLAAGFLAACAALGWATGTLSEARAAGPLLAGALFTLVRVGASGDGWARPLVPVNPDLVYRPFLQPHVRLVWIQVVVLAAITALGLSVLLGRGRRRRLTGLAGAVVLAAAVFALSRTDPAPTEIRGAPAHPVCAGDPVPVCLRPENAELLPGSERALAAASAALAPYLAVPVRFSEPGIERRVASGPGIYVPPAGPGDPLAFQAAALAAILPPPCPPPSRHGPAAMSYGDLMTWAEARVNGRAGVPPYALGRVAPVLGMDLDRQRSWVRRHLATSCAG